MTNEETALQNGYIKKDYGYVKLTEENTHWITLFKSERLQMYAYFTEDEDFDKIYDTGILDISSEKLRTLIQIFNSNHC